MDIGSIADYTLWLESEFGNIKIRNSRETLWQEIIDRTKSNLICIELGVAWGYTTNWWINKSEDKLHSWDGFDLFTGLPSRWRYFPAGSFSANGKTPKILDSRVNWHIGDVKETTRLFQPNRDSNQTLVLLFDLDLFEPSLDAWNNLKGLLKPGDFLYFDEAFDLDERNLITQHVFASFTCDLVAVSWAGLVLEVTDSKMNK
jgi:hypothetical protein